MRALLLAATLVACSAPGPSASPAPTTTAVVAPVPTALFAPEADAKPVAGGCGQTTVLQGGVPKALRDSTGNNVPSTPYALTHPATAAGFLFGYPLHVVTPGTISNKILWVVGTARTGDLVIDGHPLAASTPTVHYSQPANSGPGEIYPSGVEVPVPGCWQFTLRWSGQVAEIELEYR